MKIVQTRDELRQLISANKNKTIGFVPTMGYLHDGHLSLIERAQAECGCVVASIFVNPLQFGPQEDFESYPRDAERDARLAERSGVDILFIPDTKEMYPKTPLTTISVAKVTDSLCGASRPGHFDGVATVVAKLFNLIQPDKAYFGLKDAQQIAVIKQMVTDLNMPVDIVPCPTVREPDGLAMSSRNVYLSDEERKQATVLYRALKTAEQKLSSGQWRFGKEVESGVCEIISSQPLAQIDYVEMHTFPELERTERVEDKQYIIAVAAKFGRTRLIDNILFHGEERLPYVAHNDEGQTA